MRGKSIILQATPPVRTKECDCRSSSMFIAVRNYILEEITACKISSRTDNGSLFNHEVMHAVTGYGDAEA